MWEFSQIMLTCTILSQNGEGPFFGVIYPFISTPTMDRGRFSAHIFYPSIKCVFLLQYVRVFSKNADVHNFISGEGPVSMGWFILSISMPTMDRGRYSRHFRLSDDKMCFPSSVCESFLKKCWRAQFYLKMAKVLSRLFLWFIQNKLGRFSSFPSMRMIVSFSSSIFWKNADVHNLKMAKVLTRFFWSIFLSISPHILRYPFLLSIKCVFLLQSVRVFWKNADVHNFISKWRRSWPDFFCD